MTKPEFTPEQLKWLQEQFDHARHNCAAFCFDCPEIVSLEIRICEETNGK